MRAARRQPTYVAALMVLGLVMAAPALAGKGHVLRDADGDGHLNDCPGRDLDGDGAAGPGDELDGPLCTGSPAGSGTWFCRAEDLLDIDGDGSGEVLFESIHQATARMTGPGDSVLVHAGTYGDTDGDGVVEQKTTISRSGCAQDQDAVAAVTHCTQCSGEKDRRLLEAASHGGIRDDVIIDLGHAVATAFATRDANLATIRGFHVVHQDMDTPYEDCNPSYSGTIGRRQAFEIYCPGGAAGDGLEIRDNIVDQQLEVMPPGDLSKKWHRGHVYVDGCGYVTLHGNRFEGAVYYGIHSINGRDHLTLTDNIIRADNDTPIIFNNMAYGIYTNGNNGNVIRGNFIHRLGVDASDVSAGLRIRGSTGPDPTYIENNVIRGYRHCAYFQDSVNLAPGGVVIRNNSCVSDGTGTYGVSALVWTAATLRLHNNIISGYKSLFQGTPTAAVVSSNLVHGYDRIYRDSNTGSNVSWGGGDVCHSSMSCGAVDSLYLDCRGGSACDPSPRFLGTGGIPSPWFHLQAGSPAVDAGDSAQCGHQPLGSGCDMGAFEFKTEGDPPADVRSLRRTDIRAP